MRSTGAEGAGDGWRDYTDLKRMLRALGDAVRLNILRALARDDEVKVTDLAERLMVSQPLVSWHLTILRRMEFVRTRRQGREVYCSLDAARYRQCVALLAAVIGEEPGQERSHERSQEPRRGRSQEPGQEPDRQPARVGPVSSGRRRKDGESRH